ncbi:DEAD H (Asp-Glu-Ala-Asp His) box helicase 11 [Coemansia thaxteri]|nr:DEAD H (Asp-Glu-Ala-Asp His) box helicase 11 [Coemansia thaxteri]
MANVREEKRLETPQTADEFSFPMAKAYDIQVEFMQRLFETIERQEVAIFESPTGTGKSLSIICGALTWLQRNAARDEAEGAVGEQGKEAPDDGPKPDWVVAYEQRQGLAGGRGSSGRAAKAEARKRFRRWEAATRRREARQARSGDKWQARSAAAGSKRTHSDEEEEEEARMVVDACGSDGEGAAPEIERLLARRRAGHVGSDGSESSESEPDEPSETKVLYASRTHSQLQQFVGEIKRTRFAHQIKCVALGSRWQLCTNGAVRRSCATPQALNERCIELGAGCALQPRGHTALLDFRDAVTVADIEDLAAAGRAAGTCAYYGARAAVAAAHVVALPYAALLSRSARAALGVQVRGNVVVVDEAHNVVDALLALHSAALAHRAVRLLLDVLTRYVARFWRRLGPANATHLRHAVALLRALDKFMRQAEVGGAARVLPVNEFLHLAHADHINVYRIDRFLRESRVGRKLNMFAEKRAAGSQPPPAKRPQPDTQGKRPQAHAPAVSSSALPAPPPPLPPPSSTLPAAAIAALEEFMACLGRPDRAGSRLVVRAVPQADGASEVELKYLLLDPSEPFAELCAEARAVVLAGGTMQPADDVIEQLLPPSSPSAVKLPRLDPANARVFAWRHVVDPSHVLPLVVASGPTGEALRFARDDQADARRLREAGLALAALVPVIPGGAVAFFPSYALLARMHAAWTEAGIVERMARRKPVFMETSSFSSSAEDDVLARYTAEVRRPGSTGALLLSVVGGRLSEGINFADDLGRAVIMIGVPFPNLASPELAERLAYYQDKSNAPRDPKNSMGPRARRFYEALCMRAVNQSIGRAIRHRADYAAILFLDSRYAEPRIASKLPKWITNESISATKFGPALAQLVSFYKRDFTA